MFSKNPEIADLQKTITKLQADIDKTTKAQKPVSGIGNVTASNKVLTVDMSTSISQIMKAIKTAQNSVDSLSVKVDGNPVINGTANYLPKFTDAGLVDSIVWQSLSGDIIQFGFNDSDILAMSGGSQVLLNAHTSGDFAFSANELVCFSISGVDQSLHIQKSNFLKFGEVGASINCPSSDEIDLIAGDFYFKNACGIDKHVSLQLSSFDDDEYDIGIDGAVGTSSFIFKSSGEESFRISGVDQSVTIKDSVVLKFRNANTFVQSDDENKLKYFATTHRFFTRSCSGAFVALQVGESGGVANVILPQLAGGGRQALFVDDTGRITV